MQDSTSDISGKQLAVLQVSVLVVALCGIVYELLIATVSSYLLGDSVRQFSITIGLFMAAMGLGAYITKFISRNLVAGFIVIEVIIALVGGLSCIILFFVFPHSVFYEPTMYGLIIVIGSLVGMEIPILTRVLTPTDGLKKSIANVLSLDYFGALVGSISFPLFLLPFFGLFRASFFIGGINIVIAIVTIMVFRDKLAHRQLLMTLTGAIAVMLAVSFFYSNAITTYAESQLYTDQIVYGKQTRYQKIIVTRDQTTGFHRLFIDGHIQFAEADEYRYHEALVHPIVSVSPIRKTLLILGGGDGMAAREALKYEGVEKIDLVDLDPEMTRFCATFAPIKEINGGALSDSRVTVHNKDAWQFVKESKNLYDIIIIDLPDPHSESLNKLYSREFYTLLAERMKKDSLVVTQSTSPLVTTNTFWSISETLQAAGMKTFSYQVSLPSFSGGWGFTLAQKAAHPPEIFDIPSEKTRFLTSDVMKVAGVFGKDELPTKTIVNSIFKPQLYLTYNKDVSLW